MAAITNVLDGVRVDLNDQNKSRFKDSDLLSFAKTAIRRAAGTGYSQRLSFMRTSFTFTVPAGDDSYPLPLDFMVQASVWEGTKQLNLVTDEEYEGTVYTRPMTSYIIEDGSIVFLAGADEDTEIKLRYYVDVKPDNMTLSSAMPWGDRLNHPIAEYIKLRALNVDRYSTSVDAQLMTDLDNLISNIYIDLDPYIGEAVGAL